MYALIIQVRWIVKIGWMVLTSNWESSFFFFFLLGFGFHSKLKLMAKLQGPSLCFLDLGPVVLICHVAEQSEWVNLSRLLEHFLMIAKLQGRALPPIHAKVKLEEPFLWWPIPWAGYTGVRNTVSWHKKWLQQMEESRLDRTNLYAWKTNKKFTQRLGECN